MSSPGIQLAPQSRHDLRGDVAEQAGVSTAPDVLDMLAALDAAIADARNGEFLWRRRFGAPAAFWALQVRGLRAARAMIAGLDNWPAAICPACGTLNVLWFEPGGAARYPCVGSGCNHRVIKIAGHGSPPGLADEGGGAVPGAPADPIDPVGAAGAGSPGAVTANATDGAAPAAASTAGAADPSAREGR